MRIAVFLFIFSVLFGAKIQLGKEVLSVEIADTNEKRAYGLMFRAHLPEGQGMLFIFPKAERLSFWMKDTLIPLSIAFFDEKKRVINILDMDPPMNSSIHYQSHGPALYALEVPLGWFDKHQIRPGTQFSFLD